MDADIYIQVQAACIQPLDSKAAKLAYLPLSYPTIPGIFAAGIVEEVGQAVKKVQKGDRVVCGLSWLPSRGNPKYGGMQRYTVAAELETTKVPCSATVHTICTNVIDRRS